MVSMRCVVIGGSGQIGCWLLRALSARGHAALGTYASVPFPGLVHLDAAELATTREWIMAQGADVVFYPAGFTWVDGCERDPGRAHGSNCDQPLNVARAVASTGGRFIYFSTDYVFDGTTGPYQEDSGTNPLSVYGQSKLRAEQALARELGDRQLTLRTSWVYGPERQGKNFAYQLVSSLSRNQAVTVPADQISSPAYGPDVAAAAVALAEEGASGLIHVVGPEVVDRLTFARQIARAFGHDDRLIAGKRTIELGQGAPRPLNGGLSNARLEALHPFLMRPMAPALDDFRDRLRDPELRDWLEPVAGYPAH
jgi:dTDP-4-dehydrorhamnose reductase